MKKDVAVPGLIIIVLILAGWSVFLSIKCDIYEDACNRLQEMTKSLLAVDRVSLLIPVIDDALNLDSCPLIWIELNKEIIIKENEYKEINTSVNAKRL